MYPDRGVEELAAHEVMHIALEPLYAMYRDVLVDEEGEFIEGADALMVEFKRRLHDAMTVILLILGAIAVLVGALYAWSRKSEHEIDYDKREKSEEEANGQRFGIAVGSSQGLNGGM